MLWFTDIFGVDDQVPSETIPPLLPSVAVGIADDTASADPDVESVVRMAADPEIRCELGMKDVFEGLLAAGKQIISWFIGIDRRRAGGMRHVMREHDGAAIKRF